MKPKLRRQRYDKAEDMQAELQTSRWDRCITAEMGTSKTKNEDG
jgi:hypothetical protein